MMRAMPSPSTRRPADPPCPCGLPARLSACCGRWHGGALHLQAPDAERLMRSRYSAYVLQDADYLRATWHPSTRPAQLALEPGTHWLGLAVRAHRLLDDSRAEVEFVARSRAGGGPATRLHERSRFVRENTQGAWRWFYVDGDFL